jgi:hypothetical protein
MMLIESELSTLGSGLWEFYRRLRLRASFRRENSKLLASGLDFYHKLVSTRSPKAHDCSRKSCTVDTVGEFQNQRYQHLGC